MRPFDIIRAAFYLLAGVAGVMLVETLMVLSSCIWVIAIEGREPIGACANAGTQIREVLSELLAAILALILAGRPPPAP